MAADFRHRWHRDVIVDIIGYRRWVSMLTHPSTGALPPGATTSARSLPEIPACCSAPQRRRSQERRMVCLHAGCVSSSRVPDGKLCCHAGMGTMSWTIHKLPYR